MSPDSYWYFPIVNYEYVNYDHEGPLHARGGRILVCGLFTRAEMGSLVRATSSLTDQHYRVMLYDRGLPLIRLQHLIGYLFHQQDNTPCQLPLFVYE